MGEVQCAGRKLPRDSLPGFSRGNVDPGGSHMCLLLPTMASKLLWSTLHRKQCLCALSPAGVPVTDAGETPGGAQRSPPPPAPQTRKQGANASSPRGREPAGAFPPGKPGAGRVQEHPLLLTKVLTTSAQRPKARKQQGLPHGRFSPSLPLSEISALFPAIFAAR